MPGLLRTTLVCLLVGVVAVELLRNAHDADRDVDRGTIDTSIEMKTIFQNSGQPRSFSSHYAEGLDVPTTEVGLAVSSAALLEDPQPSSALKNISGGAFDALRPAEHPPPLWIQGDGVSSVLLFPAVRVQLSPSDVGHVSVHRPLGERGVPRDRIGQV